MLRPLHKNAFVVAIKEAGLDPTLFRSEEITFPADPKIAYEKKSPIFIIKVMDSTLKFCIRNDKAHKFDSFMYMHTFFTPEYIESGWSASIAVFDELLIIFKEWLTLCATPYIEDMQLPDLWAQMEIGKAFLQDSAITDKSISDFTEPEKENLRCSVEEFRRLVTENFKPDQEQSESINLQLDYLAKAVDRLNRRDWSSVALSTIISIATTLCLDTEKGRLLYNLFSQVLQATLKLLL